MIKSQPWHNTKIKFKSNLNDEPIRHDDGPWHSIQNNTAQSSPQLTVAYFRDLEENLIKHINDADAVVGCVAWLTNVNVLRALSELKGGTSIIVQKEDFLRPDSYDGLEWKEKLRQMYMSMSPFWLTRYDCPIPLSGMSVCCDPHIEAIRCMGIYDERKAPDTPRMHNKFLVFGRVTDELIYFDENNKCYRSEEKDPNIEYVQEERMVSFLPYAVWTGSFNVTANATMSLENAVFIRDDIIAEAYYKEWAQIAALSEPLDWEHEYINPEWRVGT